jgi:serine/threonine protein kinase
VTDNLVIGGQLGNYLIDSVIGRGGMSVVYRAKHSRLGMPVALKVLAPELSSDDSFRERFLREAQMAAAVDHPNVIPIHDMGVHEHSLYIVMRFVAGGDLKDLLATSGPLEPDVALALLMPVALALDAAHAHGLVHRDVKPANILLQRSAGGEVEHVYLTDFGIAKSSSSMTGLTRAGAFIGTIEYMAPEQVESREVSARTDVYALGATFYESLTGQIPFQRELAEGARPPTGALEPVSSVRPGLPAALDPLIAKALARDPLDRYVTCEQFLRACSYALENAQAANGQTEAPAAPTALSATPSEPLSAPSEPPAPLTGLPSTPSEPPSAQSEPPAPLTAVPSTPSEPPASETAGAGSAPTAEPAEPEPEPLVAQGADAHVPPAEPPAPPPKGPDRQSVGASPRRRRWYAAGLAAVLVAAVVVVVLVLASGSSTPTGRLSSSALAQVPTNHVTGSGNVALRLNGDRATVTLTTNGLDNDAALVHAMHIHAGGKGECPPASAARLHNGHLTISTGDGINYYGPPVQALTTRGDTSPTSILAFPRFPTGGAINYTRTIIMPASVVNDIRENNAVIVVHGIDYDGTGIYSGVLDKSDLDPALPGTATAPALCGVLRGQSQSAGLDRPSNGHGVLYAASLAPNAWLGSPVGESLLCHAPEAPAVDARRQKGTEVAAQSQATA